MWCVVHVSVLHVGCASFGLLFMWVSLCVACSLCVCSSCGCCGLRFGSFRWWSHRWSSCVLLFVWCVVHVYVLRVDCSSGGLFFLSMFFMYFVFMRLFWTEFWFIPYVVSPLVSMFVLCVERNIPWKNWKDQKKASEKRQQNIKIKGLFENNTHL